VRQGAGEHRDRRRRVHADADPPGWHEAYELARDDLLGRPSPTLSRLERFGATNRAAPNTTDDAMVLERLEVAADRHGAHPEPVRELLDAQRPVDAEQVGERLAAAFEVYAALRAHSRVSFSCDLGARLSHICDRTEPGGASHGQD